MELKEEFEKKFVKSESDGSQSNYGETYIDADYYELWTWIEQKIKEACKEQREICYERSREIGFGEIEDVEDAILNAPEPK